MGVEFIFRVTILLALGSISHTIEWNNAAHVRWALNCDFPLDKSFESQPSPGDKCGDICQKTSPCTHFVWTSQQNGTCWLKSINDLLDAENPVKNSTVQPTTFFQKRATTRFDVSGVSCGFLQIAWHDSVGSKINEWGNNCDFPGQDLDQRNSLGKDCRQLCRATKGCTHFRWDFETCRMKSGVPPLRAKAVYKPRSVCGIEMPSDNIATSTIVSMITRTTSPPMMSNTTNNYECQCVCDDKLHS